MVEPEIRKPEYMDIILSSLSCEDWFGADCILSRMATLCYENKINPITRVTIVSYLGVLVRNGKVETKMFGRFRRYRRL